MPSEDQRQPNPQDVARASEWIAGQRWDAESFQKFAATRGRGDPCEKWTNLSRRVDRC